MNYISDFFNIFLINPLTNLFVLLDRRHGQRRHRRHPADDHHPPGHAAAHAQADALDRAMMALGPAHAGDPEEYKDPKRRSARADEALREAGINPLGCFSSMLLQMPILIALYRMFTSPSARRPKR